MWLMRLKGVEHMKMFCFNNAALHPLLYGLGLFFNATYWEAGYTALMQKSRDTHKKKWCKIYLNVGSEYEWLYLTVFLWISELQISEQLVLNHLFGVPVPFLTIFSLRRAFCNAMCQPSLYWQEERIWWISWTVFLRYQKKKKKKRKLTLKSVKPHIFWAIAKRFWSNY